MRISDWSSDVCSSDLRAGQSHRDHIGVERFAHANPGVEPPGAEVGKSVVGEYLYLDLGIGFTESREDRFEQRLHRAAHQVDAQPPRGPVAEVARRFIGVGKPGIGGCRAFRSEEPTSELQSLMRNSYAVFCLKKNK